MTKLVLGFCALFFFTASAHAGSEFTGHWQGPGSFQNEELLQPIPADFDIVIKAENSHLVIDECWVMQSASGQKRKTCYHSDYAITDNYDVMLGEEKIGNIYPGKISIYQGNSQVSELMGFDLNEKRELLFRYNYSNYDGMIITKMAQLPEVTK